VGLFSILYHIYPNKAKKMYLFYNTLMVLLKHYHKERNKMKVDIKYYPNDEAITVQFGFMDNGVFTWETCNHAGAVEEETSEMGYDPYAEDIYDTESVMLVCDKCEEIVEDY